MRKRLLAGLAILFLVNFFFFASFYLKGMLPFPGDLLLAEYNPFRQYSFFGYAPGAIPHKAQSFDTLRQLYPWRFLSIETLKKGHWPLWNPYNFSGSPLLANFQSAAFYPLNFLYWLLDFKTAWGLQVVIQSLLASFFFFLFARKLKISFFGSLLAAMALGYSSFMTVWLEYNTIGQVILWLPLLLWLVELLKEKITFWRGSGLVVVLTFSFLAGHFQDFGMVWLFSLIFFLLRNKKKTYAYLWVLPFCLAAAQVLPGLELIINSARTALPKDFLLGKVLLQPWQIVVAWVPDFFGNPATRNYFLPDTYIGKVLYVGLLPLTLALFTWRQRNNWRVKFFGLTALGALFLATSQPLSAWFYSWPLFSSLSPTRVLFLFQFSLALLAGIGFDLWQNKKEKHWWPILVGIGLLFLGSWLFASGKLWWGGEVFLTNINVVRRNLLYSTLLLTATVGLLFLGKQKFWRLTKIVPWLMIVLVVLDLFRFFKKITPFSAAEYIFPEVEIFQILKEKAGRFWGYGTASIPSNYNLIYETYSPEGYDPLYPRWYGEWVRLAEEGLFKLAIRSDAFITPGFGKINFSQNQFRQKILAGLSVSSILDREENQTDETTFSPKEYPLFWQGGGWRIYNNLKAAPKAFFAKKVFFAESKTDFEKIFNRPDFWPNDQVILNENLKKEDWSEGMAKITAYEQDLVKIETENKEKGVLVLTDTYFPGWYALIDGQKTKIFRANHALRAILVPAGSHQIQFIYRPISFAIGLSLSLLSIISLILLILSKIFIKRRKK